MLKNNKHLRQAIHEALLSRFARTTWLTFLLILAYAAVLRTGVLG